MPKNMISFAFRSLALCFALLGILALCACGPASGDKPSEAVQGFFQAMHQGDYADAWDLVAATDQTKLEEELQQLLGEGARDALARLNAQYGTTFSADQLRGIGPEEFFVTAMRSGVERDQQLRRQLSEMPTIQGNTIMLSDGLAEIQVRFAGGELKQFRVVREAGEWRMSWLAVKS